MHRPKVFLASVFFIGSLWLLAPARAAPLASTPLPDHPRLLLLRGEEEAIKRNLTSDPIWTRLHDAILAECEALLDQPPLRKTNKDARRLAARTAGLRRVFFLAYAQRMTGRDAYLKRAEAELLALAAFDDWNPSHFLDTAEITMAAAIGYDWLYHGLSPQTRAIVKDAILKKGLEPSLDPRFNKFTGVTHNWNQVCNAGITWGALALHEDYPELSMRLVNRAIESIALPMNDYNPDGAYPEGYSYWSYGTSFNVLYIAAMEKAFGDKFILPGQEGFLKSAGYMQSMEAPSGQVFNYSDSGPEGELKPAMFWFAGRLRDASLLWHERTLLRESRVKELVNSRLSPALMLWGPATDLARVTEPRSHLWVGGGPNPVALMRTSWTDPEAIFVGFKGGSPTVNHAHMDVGSFVMEADGVRWAMDFGLQNYGDLEARGIKVFRKEQHAQRWQIYRASNYAHSTLTINGELQRAAGYAPIVSSSASPSCMHATVDFSELYKGQLARANRGVAIVDRDYVTIRDELEALPEEATVRWQMLTGAEVKIVARNKAELTKAGKKLFLEVQQPDNIDLKIWSTAPPKDYDAPNPGTALVGFEVKLPPNSREALTVLLVPEKARDKTSRDLRPLAEWPGDRK